MFKFAKAWLIGGLVLAVSSVHANTQLGLQYYDEGNLSGAYSEFLQAAGVGDHLAQRNLGAMYVQGDHVDQDLVQAYAWLALAAQDADLAEAKLHEKVLASLSEEQRVEAKAAHRALLERYGDQALSEYMTPEFTGAGVGVQRLRPVKTVSPDYPRSAARSGSSGWVDILFTVEKDGTTSDHLAYFSTLDSMKQVSIEAARQFQYEPTLVDGSPIAVHGVTTRFVFQMEGENDSQARTRLLQRRMNRMKDKAEQGSPQDQFLYAYMIGAMQSYNSNIEVDDNLNDWFLAAANQDFHPAGFFLGRNILYGNQCEADSELSHQWLLRSAINGVEESQYMLAMELMSGVHFEKDERKALYWLERAGQDHTAARLRHAWFLATHPEGKLRNGRQAMQLWQEIDDTYHDKQRYYQTAAAVAAEQGDFDAAVSWQEQAVQDAKDLELPLQTVEARLASYRAGNPWREAP